MQIHHVAIQIANPSKTVDFYTQVLGFRLCRSQEHSVWLDANGTLLMLEFCTTPQQETSWKSTSAGFHLLAFTIDAKDRSTWKEKLQRENIRIEGETNFTIYFRDPEGNRLGLSHYPTPKE